MSQYLIKTVEVLKEHVPFAYTEQNFDRVKPFVLIAQETYLKRYLGAELYEQLLNHADPIELSVSGSASSSSSSSTSVSSTWLTNLLTECRRALAFLTLYEGFPVLEVQFSSDGVHRVEGDEIKSLHSGQRARLEVSLLKHGFNLLEKVVSYLEANENRFPSWVASTAYTIHKGRVIRSAEEYTKIWSKINYKHSTYVALDSFMREVEEDTLLELLGEDLHASWFEDRKDGELSPNNQALLGMMQRIVAYQAAAEAMPELSLYIESYGVFTPIIAENERNVQELSKAQESRFAQTRERLKEKAEVFKRKLRDYLNANASTYSDFDYDSTNTVNTGSIRNQGDNGVVKF